MKSVVQISRGIESLFGTRDENIRLIESSLNVRTRLLNDSLEIEGEEASVARAVVPGLLAAIPAQAAAAARISL